MAPLAVLGVLGAASPTPTHGMLAAFACLVDHLTPLNTYLVNGARRVGEIVGRKVGSHS